MTDHIQPADTASNKDLSDRLETYLTALHQVTEDIKEYYPKTVLLFGSLARYLAGDRSRGLPNDMDILYVGTMAPTIFTYKDYGVKIQPVIFQTHQMIGIAESLRYDLKPIALAKLYGKNVLKRHSKDVIAAAILLGPSYNDFGIEQIEVDGVLDTRDYSIHQVLYGKDWWDKLTAYARERRGPFLKLTDTITFTREFKA